jgi:vacuolar-type H+-ATPase catalytic subunit A/Vma1
MSGEGHTTSFKRTTQTTKSNKQLLEEFKGLVYSSKRVMSHMKWYGKEHSVELVEHGDEEQPKWRQESVAIKDTFEFYISTYESWYRDANNYECHETEGSFVSLAREFAHNNKLMYFPDGFPTEWIEQKIIDGEKHWNHFIVQPDDKNIDKICKVWHYYGIMNLRANSEEKEKLLWDNVKKEVKQLMEQQIEKRVSVSKPKHHEGYIIEKEL